MAPTARFMGTRGRGRPARGVSKSSRVPSGHACERRADHQLVSRYFMRRGDLLTASPARRMSDRRDDHDSSSRFGELSLHRRGNSETSIECLVILLGLFEFALCAFGSALPFRLAGAPPISSISRISATECRRSEQSRIDSLLGCRRPRGRTVQVKQFLLGD